MTDTRWTPGPWMREPIWPDRPVPVAGFTLSHFSRGGGGAEAEANTRLIVVAPKLYDILDQIAKSGQLDSVLQTFADAALAEARGENND